MMRRSSVLYALLLAALVAAGLLLRYAGLTEPLQLHPDERIISVWMDRMAETGSLKPQTYPGGFFVLAHAARQTLQWAVAAPLHRWAYFLGSADRLPPPRSMPSPSDAISTWDSALFASCSPPPSPAASPAPAPPPSPPPP
ncbi:MAG: hypothetical protein GX548_02355 [Lentisphaerae bacterium]|nr:hypothetical protein [Lentisphaerota bacterium]